ncbi:MAG: hypothetical protein ABR562_08020 [Thermoplasmatota archaeon]
MKDVGVGGMMDVCGREGCGLPLHIEFDGNKRPGIYHFVNHTDAAGHNHLVLRKRGRNGCRGPRFAAP